MHLLTFTVLAAGLVQPTLAANYLDLATIKNFYTTGASIDWYGAPLSDYSNTANGPNHIEYLAYNRNWNIRKYAYPGAITDPAIVPYSNIGGIPAPVVNWNVQIEYVKGQFSADKGSSTAANGANSLFIIAASTTGNDILNSWNASQGSPGAARSATINAILDKFGKGLNDLYAAGGRNFIWFSVLPVHKTPYIQNLGASAVATTQAYVEEFQSKMKDRVNYLQAYYPDANIYLPDFTQAFYDILSGNLKSGPTVGYLNRNSYCQGVKDDSVGLTKPRNPNYNNCPYAARARQWAFRDEIHVTSPTHCEYAYRTLFTLVGYNAAYPSNCQYAARTD